VTGELPDGSRVVHVGPHKTGTTALQAALWDARPAMLRQGVRHVGRSRNPSAAVRAVVGQNSPYGRRPPPMRDWHELVREFRRASEPRAVVSSEFFAYARPDVIRRIADDLDAARLHVVVTVRPLVRILPSMWQQNVQAGMVTPWTEWLDGIVGRPSTGANRGFWVLERHDELIGRWVDALGRDRVVAVVVDDRDRGFLLRAFENLLGLSAGTLNLVPDLVNRSLTVTEAEAVRAVNVAFKAEGLPRDLHARTIRFGAAQLMKRRTPAPGEAGVVLAAGPTRDRVEEIQRDVAAGIAASGVRVIGDLSTLADDATDRVVAGSEARGAAAIAPEAVASLALGLLQVTGAIRDATVAKGPFRFAEPVEVARVPTYQLVGSVGARLWRRTFRRLLPGREDELPEPDPELD
jgi:hypothetical protein